MLDDSTIAAFLFDGGETKSRDGSCLTMRRQAEQLLFLTNNIYFEQIWLLHDVSFMCVDRGITQVVLFSFSYQDSNSGLYGAL